MVDLMCDIHILYRESKALLILGSAVVLMCCGTNNSETGKNVALSKERLLTESSRNLSVVMTENGRPSYIFDTPLVEGYTLAKEPYREFREGVEITTFSDDSLSVKESVLTSNYAIFYEDRQLWEARGDVEVMKSDGKELYSQQLFWNAQTKRIYSNVETKIVDRVTGDVYQGDGFESDEAMEDWSFRRMSGRMKVEAPRNSRDSSQLE